MAITMAVSVAAIVPVGSASFDVAKTGLTAVIETMQSPSTIETRGTTGQRGQAEDPEADRVAAQALHLAKQPRRRVTRSRTG